MSGKGKDLSLSRETDPPKGLAKRAKEILKSIGLDGWKILVIDGSGTLLEETAEDYGGASEQVDREPQGGADSTEDTQVAVWTQVQAKIDPLMTRVSDAGLDPDGRFEQVWATIGGGAAAGNFAAALMAAQAFAPRIVALLQDAPSGSQETDPKTAAVLTKIDEMADRMASLPNPSAVER